jgi:hypothetical protein
MAREEFLIDVIQPFQDNCALPIGIEISIQV